MPDLLVLLAATEPKIEVQDAKIQVTNRFDKSGITNAADSQRSFHLPSLTFGFQLLRARKALPGSPPTLKGRLSFNSLLHMMDKNETSNSAGTPDPKQSGSGKPGESFAKQSDEPDKTLPTKGKEPEPAKDPVTTEASSNAGDGGTKAASSGENSKHPHRKTLEWDSGDAPGLGFASEQRAPAQQPPLPLDPQQVKTWVEVLKKMRCLVLRCLDTDVLFAAEFAISEREDFAGVKALLASLPTAGMPACGKLESVNDSFPLTVEALCSGSDGNELMIVVRAYESSYATSSLIFLPEHASRMNEWQAKLRNNNRYVLVLTTPTLLEVNKHHESMSLFQQPIDFLFPRLQDAELAKALELQYTAEWWTEQTPTDYRRDQEFHSNIFNCKDRLAELVRAGLEISEHPNKRQRDTFQIRRQQLIPSQSELKTNWPKPDDYLGAVLLFIASFFKDLSVASYERMVSQLLSDGITRQPVPLRSLQGREKGTQIQVFRDVPWQRVWKDAKDSKIANCLALRVAPRDGTIAVVPKLAPEPRELLKAFSITYPFIWAELWERVLDMGLLFDPDLEVSQQVRKRIVERVAAESTRFGQTFLSRILFSDKVLGALQGDLEERFEALQKRGELNFVILCLSDLLDSMLSDVEARETGISALKQLIDGGAPRIVLRLLRILARNPSFELSQRLVLVARILNQSGKEYWAEACQLIRRWASNPADTATIISKIASWLPSEGSPNQPGSVAPAALVLIGLASDWLQGPPPVKTKHALPGILAASPEKDPMEQLVRWLFHPALERLFGDPAWYFSYWLLADLARSASLEEKHILDAAQLFLIDDYENALVPSFQSGLHPILPESVPAVREFQATVIADWAAALLRADSPDRSNEITDLNNALALHVYDAAKRQIYAIWRAMDLATAKYNPQTGTPAKLAREIREKLSEGRKIWKLLAERWSGQKKSTGAA